MNASAVAAARTAAIAAAVGRVRDIEAREGVTRESLAAIMIELKALAAREELFASSAFPPPPNGETGSRRYILQADADDRFALYLNALNPGNETRPHDHTTWAVVVAVEGQELNKVYRRGEGTLAVDHEVMVEPGRGIALMPEDIHSIHTTGAVPTRHLHMYGLALEKLDERKAYDPVTGAAQAYNRAFMQPSLAPLG
jgi:predicted metal-dependent enzyme (double-stranded beta helix superfamily)